MAQYHIIGALRSGKPMHTKTIYDYVANKDNYHYEARKYIAAEGKRFGYLEHTILEYASKHLYLVASEIREYIKGDIQIDLRRIHDALQRLVKKGVVEKVSRGIYRLTEHGKKLLNTLLSQRARKESDTKWRGAGAVVDGFYRARLHVRGGRGLEDLARQLYAVYSVVRCALNQVRQLLGRSRFYRVVRGVSVVCVDYFVGGHGTPVLGRGRSLRRPLVDLGYFQSLGLRPLEVGVDVFAVVGGVRPSVKVYFG